MTKSNCEQLKSYLEGHVLVFRDAFEKEYSEYIKLKVNNNITATRGTLEVYTGTLRSILDRAYTNTVRKRFPVNVFVHSASEIKELKHAEVNLRKELQIAPGVIVRVGDKVVEQGRELTVEGFEVGSDDIIASYIHTSKKLLRTKKEKEYMKLAREVFYRPLDMD